MHVAISLIAGRRQRRLYSFCWCCGQLTRWLAWAPGEPRRCEECERG